MCFVDVYCTGLCSGISASNFSICSKYLSLDSFSLHLCLKGIVHPKMKIMSSFTRPQVVPNLCEFLSSAEPKRRYFEECSLTLIVFIFLLWKSMGSVRCFITNILQNIFFCVQQERATHTGLQQLEGE